MNEQYLDFSLSFSGNCINEYENSMINYYFPFILFIIYKKEMALTLIHIYLLSCKDSVVSQKECGFLKWTSLCANLLSPVY